MDTQIWYSVFCTIVGGLYGILHHLGEVSCGFYLLHSFFSQRKEMVILHLLLKIDKDTRNAEN